MSILLAFSKLKGIDTTLTKKSKDAGTRINRVGDNFETFIQNLFDKDEISYLGNPNNPPDMMLKDGEAIEIKKTSNIESDIALNSSFPKSKLCSNDKMITKHCAGCETWKEKDFVYVIGCIKKNKIKNIWFVYGDCYAADNEVYQRIKDKFSSGIRDMPQTKWGDTDELEWANTNELARINKIDPLGITYLRVRGMWGIQHPQKVFSNVLDKENNAYMIMKKEKYDSFPSNEKNKLQALTTEIKIADPNNPALENDAILIKMNI